jgi:hypothetical protein
MRRKPLIVLALACALATCVTLGYAGIAAAESLPPAVIDCHLHSKLTRHYSASELRVALARMPPSITEYTVCYDVIERQMLSEIGAQKLTGGAGGGSGGSFLPAPVLVAIIVLALGAATLGVLALRRRRPPAG